MRNRKTKEELYKEVKRLHEEVQKLGFEKAKLDWLVRRVEMYNRLPSFLRIFYKVKFPPIFDEYLQIRPYKDEKV